QGPPEESAAASAAGTESIQAPLSEPGGANDRLSGVPGSDNRLSGVPGSDDRLSGVPGSDNRLSGVPGSDDRLSGVPGSDDRLSGVPGSDDRLSGVPGSDDRLSGVHASDETPFMREAEPSSTASSGQAQLERDTVRESSASQAPPISSPEPRPLIIVDDSVEQLEPGQMKKLEFLTELEASIDRAAEEALAGSGRSARDCPYIEYWFDFYRGQDSSHIERAIAKYAPQSAEATRATELIELITDRARSAVEVWANTGRVTGVPPGAPLLPPGREGEVPREGPAQMVLSKARPGGARQPDDPGVLLAQLGSGDSLHPAVKGRMEGAFGQDLSAVRVHTGSNAARLSDDLNARAFTVGKHIAFGGG